MAEQLQKYGVIPVSPYKQVPLTLIFNKLNGVFVATTDLPLDLCDTNDLHCIYISDMMDMDKEEVVGGLKINEDGSYEKDYVIQGINDGPFRVYESQLDSSVAYKITKEYTVVRQINIIANVVKALAAATNLDTTELDEYLDYVKLVKDTNKAHKEFYVSNPEVEYVSNAEQTERTNAIYEGGLHEVLGPRTVDGGTVF